VSDVTVFNTILRIQSVLTKIRLHAVDPQALEWQIPSNDQKVQEMSKDLRAIQLQKRGKKKHLCVFTNHQCH